MEYKLKKILITLEDKKKEIEDFLFQIDNQIKRIENEIHDNTVKTKNVINQDHKSQSRMTNEHEYSGSEYDSDDSMDRLYLMDLPKLFESK